MGAGTLMPVIVAGVESTIVEGRTLPTGLKVNGFGRESPPPGTTVKVAKTPPTFTDAVTEAALVGEERTRSASIWPLLIVPGAVVNGPPAIEYWPPETVTGAGAL